jgi:hypothetical protein
VLWETATFDGAGVTDDLDTGAILAVLDGRCLPCRN